MMKKIGMLILCTLALCLNHTQLEAKEDFVGYFAKAEQHYKNQEYDQAVRVYRTILQKGYENGQVWYNLGTAYVATQDVSQAILCYERARFFMPYDSDVLHNLHLIRQQLKLSQDESSYLWAMGIPGLSKLHFSWVYFLGFVVYALFFMSLIWGRTFFRNMTLMVLVIVMPLWGYGVYQRFGSQRMVLLQESALKNGPGENFENLQTLPLGSLCSILQFSEGWYEVKTSGRVKGWIPVSHGEMLG